MFNRLPGAMLKERHTHECRLGRNCGRTLLHNTAAVAQSHRLFNPVPPEAGLKGDTAVPKPGFEFGAVADVPDSWLILPFIFDNSKR